MNFKAVGRDRSPWGWWLSTGSRTFQHVGREGAWSRPRDVTEAAQEGTLLPDHHQTAALEKDAMLSGQFCFAFKLSLALVSLTFTSFFPWSWLSSLLTAGAKFWLPLILSLSPRNQRYAKTSPKCQRWGRSGVNILAKEQLQGVKNKQTANT